jgi:hypothetical protein
VSQALGFGFRCGFLGMLHMDIVQERLEREYGMELITTAPTVVYEVVLTDGTVSQIENPARMPETPRIAEIREPIVKVVVFVPQEYVGPGDHAVHRQARHPARPRIPRPARAPDLRDADERDRHGFLRSVEIGVARLCLDGLRIHRIPRLRTSSRWTF